jgi:hypothetical protein
MAEIAQSDYVLGSVWTNWVRDDVVGMEDAVGIASPVAANLALKLIPALRERGKFPPVPRLVIGCPTSAHALFLQDVMFRA